MQTISIDETIQSVRTHQALLSLPVLSIAELKELPFCELQQLLQGLKQQCGIVTQPKRKAKARQIRDATIRVIRMAQRALSLPVQPERDLADKSGPELVALFKRLEKQL